MRCQTFLWCLHNVQCPHSEDCVCSGLRYNWMHICALHSALFGWSQNLFFTFAVTFKFTSALDKNQMHTLDPARINSVGAKAEPIRLHRKCFLFFFYFSRPFHKYRSIPRLDPDPWALCIGIFQNYYFFSKWMLDRWVAIKICACHQPPPTLSIHPPARAARIHIKRRISDCFAFEYFVTAVVMVAVEVVE